MTGLARVNFHELVPEYDETDPEGYRAGMARFGPALGASQMGASLYELPPGQSICPYHYEYPEEEWLLVVAGRVTRAPSRRRGGARRGRHRLLPAGARRRAQGHVPRRRDGAGRHDLDEADAGDRRLPRQRQGRDLARRRPRPADDAPRHARVLRRRGRGEPVGRGFCRGPGPRRRSAARPCRARAAP